MKISLFYSIVTFWLSISGLDIYAQAPSSGSSVFQVADYSLGDMLVGVQVPNNWDVPPIIIGKLDKTGKLAIAWPDAVPAELKVAADQLNYVIRSGNCDPTEDQSGVFESKEPEYILFSRIWLLDPETKSVMGQLMATNSDSLMAWMHKPDATLAATGTYAYLLYAYQQNTLQSTCHYESWLTPEEGDEISLSYTSVNDLKIKKGFQFIVYYIKEVHPFEGMSPKWQQVTSVGALPEGIGWKVKE